MSATSPTTTGQTASITRSFSQEDVRAFAGISGDANPIHVDPEFAAGSAFGAPIVHGMLVASLFSALLAEQVPGPGTIYLGQNLKFVGPVFVGEEVTATVEVTNVRPDKPIVTLQTTATTGRGVAIEGEAVVKAPR